NGKKQNGRDLLARLSKLNPNYSQPAIDLPQTSNEKSEVEESVPAIETNESVAESEGSGSSFAEVAEQIDQSEPICAGGVESAQPEESAVEQHNNGQDASGTSTESQDGSPID